MTDPTRSAIEAYCQWCRSNERCPEMDELIAERDALIRERDEAREWAQAKFLEAATSWDTVTRLRHGKEDAESLCNALMTAGLEECEKLRDEVELLHGCCRSIAGGAENRLRQHRQMKDERDAIRAQLDAMTKERDEFRAVGMHCVEASHAALAEVTKECEQLQVQLAGCGAAALGYEKDPAKPSDYGWSASYNDTVVLRRMYDEARERVKALEGAAEQAFRADDKYGYESIATCVAFDELRRVARKGGE